jgi:hypothetical protein
MKHTATINATLRVELRRIHLQQLALDHGVDTV